MLKKELTPHQSNSSKVKVIYISGVMVIQIFHTHTCKRKWRMVLKVWSKNLWISRALFVTDYVYGETMSHSLEENTTNNKMIHSPTDSSIQLGKSEKVWDEKAGRKDRQSACEKEDFRGVSTNLHQVFTKLHQSALIYTKSWQSYTQSATICTNLH